VIITKDLSMIIYGRDARIGPRSLKNLFTGKSGTTNRSSAVYELALKSANKAGSPGNFFFSIANSLKKFIVLKF
jgi:kinesin family member 1